MKFDFFFLENLLRKFKLELSMTGIRGILQEDKCTISGLGGLGVACWPLVPKFAGSNPAVGFLGRKNPQRAFLRRESKAVGPMS